MIEIQLPDQVYNDSKLDQELQISPSYLGCVSRLGVYFVLLEADAKQTDINQILQIADAHNPSLTDEQQSEFARQELADGAETSKRSWTLIKAFNDGPESDVKEFLSSGGTSTSLNRSEPLDKTYTHWRAIFDALPDQMKVRIMWHGYMHSSEFEFNPEPETPSAAYKAWFNNACTQVVGYITDRAQG